MRETVVIRRVWVSLVCCFDVMRCVRVTAGAGWLTALSVASPVPGSPSVSLPLSQTPFPVPPFSVPCYGCCCCVCYHVTMGCTFSVVSLCASGRLSVGHIETASLPVGVSMWASQCGRLNVGVSMWVSQCGRLNMGVSMWSSQCGRFPCGCSLCGRVSW